MTSVADEKSCVICLGEENLDKVVYRCGQKCFVWVHEECLEKAHAEKAQCMYCREDFSVEKEVERDWKRFLKTTWTNFFYGHRLIFWLVFSVFFSQFWFALMALMAGDRPLHELPGKILGAASLRTWAFFLMFAYPEKGWNMMKNGMTLPVLILYLCLMITDFFVYGWALHDFVLIDFYWRMATFLVSLIPLRHKKFYDVIKE